ncbi:MAG: hypothetical protein IKC93_05205 [Candidatus Methanomethylophilaceae archaeon]|nr:hypothetical protein [Candidatus Methanomethylophilaceae archaeon]
MKSRIWDKVPRLDRLFIDVFGARMPDLSEEDSETVLKDVCRCWFLGAVARQQGDQTDVRQGTFGRMS